MNKTDTRHIFAVAMVSATALGVLSYFLPVINFIISVSYISLVKEGEFTYYIPVILSVASLVCSVLFMYGKEKFVYITGITEIAAFVMIFIAMNEDSYVISASDCSGIGYILFMIAHIAAVIACVAYVIKSNNPAGGKDIMPEEKTKICPSCGKTLPENAVFCSFCGKNTGIIPAERFAKRCRFCDHVLDDEAVFCPICGKTVKDELKPVKKHCPKCGTELLKGTSVCPVCSNKKEDSLGKGWYISDELG